MSYCHRDVVRCDKADISGLIRLATVKCPNGLAFDLDLQVQEKVLEFVVELPLA